MTTMIKPDTRGIEALSGKLDDTVTQLPAVIWEQILEELGPLPEAPTIDPFDDEPWLKLPTLEDLEELWAQSQSLESLIYETARRAAPATGGGIASYVDQQWALAEMELKLIKGREAQDAAETTTDDVGAAGAAGGDGSVASVDASGGGVDFPGGSQDGDTVGEGGQVAVGADVGGSSKVPRRRRSGKAARG